MTRVPAGLRRFLATFLAITAGDLVWDSSSVRAAVGKGDAFWLGLLTIVVGTVVLWFCFRLPFREALGGGRASAPSHDHELI